MNKLWWVFALSPIAMVGVFDASIEDMLVVWAIGVAVWLGPRFVRGFVRGWQRGSQ